jgi:hypothetical protein
MKKATEAWLDYAHRDLEAAKLLVDHEYVSNAVLFHADVPLFGFQDFTQRNGKREKLGKKGHGSKKYAKLKGDD